MKTKVKTIHGKILVQGGENPENELKPHEILVKESTDGSVELMERDSNGDVVSISGGSGGSGKSKSIPFYWHEPNSDVVQKASLSYNGTIPNSKYYYNGAIWRDYYWDASISIDNFENKYNPKSYEAAFSYYYYTDSSHDTIIKTVDSDISFITSSPRIDVEVVRADALMALKENNTINTDLDCIYYYYYSNSSDDGYHFRAAVTTKLSGLWRGYFGEYCHYNYKEKTLTPICNLAYLIGLMSTMKNDKSTWEPMPASEDGDEVATPKVATDPRKAVQPEESTESKDTTDTTKDTDESKETETPEEADTSKEVESSKETDSSEDAAE